MSIVKCPLSHVPFRPPNYGTGEFFCWTNPHGLLHIPTMKKFPKWIAVGLLPLALYGQNPQRTTAPALFPLEIKTVKSEPKIALALVLPAPKPAARPVAVQGPTY